MSLNSAHSAIRQRPIPTQGQHQGVCYSIIDLGTQMESFKGEVKTLHKVHVSWELPKVTAKFKQKGTDVEVVKPLGMFQEYTLSSDTKANFSKMIDSWVGNGKHIELITPELCAKLIGRNCMIQVVYVQDKTKVDSVTNKPIIYANIAIKGTSIFPKEASLPILQASNEKILFDLDKFSWEVFNKIPSFLQEKIKKCSEWSGILQKHGANPADGAGEVSEESVADDLNNQLNASIEEEAL